MNSWDRQPFITDVATGEPSYKAALSHVTNNMVSTSRMPIAVHAVHAQPHPLLRPPRTRRESRAHP